MVGCGLAGGLWWWRSAAEEPAPVWRRVAVSRQDVRSTVSATGLLEARVTVEVGTQISGQIAELPVDFNDAVEAGQVVARLDDRLLRANVDDARAAVAVASASLTLAQRTLARERGLQREAAGTVEAVEIAETAVAMAEAVLQQARVALGRADANLDQAVIRSPVAGTVIRRDVDVGQTVNAGMSAPTLFLIAGDLSRMQVLAAVDEADIGRVKEGQAVSFTVQAWPADKFSGVVEQVRMQATTTENVVTFGVVIGVDNPSGKLLPGMTATIEVIVEEAPAALCVENAALRFAPEPAWIAGGAAPEASGGPPAASAGAGGGPPAGAPAGGRSKSRSRGGPRTVWTVAEGGLLAPVEVVVGLTTSTCTQITGEAVVEGLELVAGVERAQDAAGGASPFQPSTATRSRPGGL